MKALKDIPFEKIYDGMKIKFSHASQSIPGRVLMTKYAPGNINISDDGKITRSECIKQIVIDTDDGPVTTIEHKRCEKVYFAE